MLVNPGWPLPTDAVPSIQDRGSPTQLGTSFSLLSFGYMYQASWSCLRLLRHRVVPALALALASAGSNIPARIAMIAMTTSSSISVKAKRPALLAHFPRSESWVLIEEFLGCHGGSLRVYSFEPQRQCYLLTHSPAPVWRASKRTGAMH